VKLINTDGMAFIGPGSEWFWTAISGLVLVITFFAIYRQLRVQRDVAATGQLSDLLSEWSSERMCRAKLAILLAIQAGVEQDQLPNRAVAHVGYFWSRIGYLVKTGHMDRELVNQHLGPQVQMWRTWLGAEDFEDFGWLARASAAMDVKAGDSGWLDAAFLADQVPKSISHFGDAIELEEALRTVTVRLTPTPIPVRAERAARAPGRTTGDMTN
jgi:hypothetical protein